MGYAPEHREATRQRILDSAGRLFRSKGYAGARIEEIMAGAGLTRGGFYLHFKSKQDLFACVVAEEFDFARQMRLARDRRDDAPELGAREAIDFYLTPENRARVARGCTVVSNAADVARGSKAARRAFGRNLEDLVGEFARLARGAGADARGRAQAAVATCVGGVVLARALDDPETIDDLLGACRAAVHRTLGGTRAGADRVPRS